MKPVRLACWDLSCAILTLETHHGHETLVFDEARAAFQERIADAAASPVSEELAASGERIAGIAASLREARAALVAELVGMRVAIHDLTEEESTLRPSGSVLLADTADTTTLAPVPIGGWSALTPLQALRILNETVRWSRKISYSQAGAAIGPCYLLAKTIEYPKPQASGLRDIAGEAHDHLRTFLHSAYGS